MQISARVEKLLETPIRFFYDKNFDVSEQRKKILAEMPDFDVYKKNMFKMEKIKTNKINPEMYPCYQSPLLSFDQEQHLFRQMNYFKYKASKIIKKIDIMNPNESKVKIAELFLQKAIEVRNMISSSNFRLATQIMKHRRSSTEKIDTDAVLSDAYVDVIKAVDYFNWTLGHRFSTYATWVIRKNYFRDSKNKSSQSERLTSIDDGFDFVESKNSQAEDERDHKSRQILIKNLIGMLVRENLGTDRIRQAFVLENYFGVNGRDKKTLEQISEEIGVTKERVRQLKERGLEWIQKRVSDMSLDYDNDMPSETLF